MTNKLIILIIILVFALVSNIFMKNTENYENIHTLSLNESEFYPDACKNIITTSGSNGCPKMRNYQMEYLLSRGGNN